MVEVRLVLRRGEGQVERAGVVLLVVGDQRLGLVHVLLLREAGVLQVARRARGEGTVGDREDALLDGLADGGLVPGVGQRAADPLVGQRRVRAVRQDLRHVEQRVADLGVVADLLLREVLVVPELGDDLAVVAVHQVDRAALQGVTPVERVRDGTELDLVEVRVGLVPVVRVLLGLEELVRLVVLVDERAGADRLGLQRLVLVRRRHPRRRGDVVDLADEQHLGEGHPWRLHLDVDGERIGRVDGRARPRWRSRPR